MLCHVATPSPPHWTADNIITGQVHQFYIARETWARVMKPEHPSLYIHRSSLGYMALMIAGIVYLGRRRTRLSYSSLGMLCLLPAVVAYIAGAIALKHNVEPRMLNPWLVFMLLPPFYGGIACIALAAIDWIGPDKVHRKIHSLCRTPAQRRRERVANGQCAHCGYDLRGNPMNACPECGCAPGHVPVV